MNKLYYIPVFIICLIVLTSPQTVFSQEERLAVVSTFNGEVRVQHDGVWKTVTKVGNRIRNSSVYNGDTVLTMPGAHVDLVFSDNTTLKVEADTTLTISTRQITAEDMAKEGFVRNVAGTRQEVVRSINVKIGKLWASITPSKSVLTEFESPTGIASVRGTTLTFSFLGGITGIDLIKGLLDFAATFSKMYLDFDSGDSSSISDIPGETKVKVESGNGITYKTNKGTVTIKVGGSLDVNVDPVTGEMRVVSANGVTITADGTTTDVKSGDDLGTATAHDGEGITYGSDPNVGGDEENDDGDDGDDGDDDGSDVDDDPNAIDQNALGGQNEDIRSDDCSGDRDCDGVLDSQDAFPNDPTEWADSDKDGVGDNADVFPNDPTEWADSDKDGVGDNADAFPNDPTETVDTDGDGVGDNADAFPNDPTETKDSDKDGVGDNADAFPNDPTETKDSDKDGVGDNADAFPDDPTETKDSDKDGVGDNADAFPDDPTETKDSDNDGVGDNADAFPNDPAETKDSDNDGVGDNADAFPNDPAETTDTDGDGVGDNADIDADGDGIPDVYDQFPLDITNENNFFDNFSGGLGKWDTATNVRTDESFGPIVAPGPPGGGVGMPGPNHFAIVQTNGVIDGLLSKQFDFAVSANRRFTFNYNFVTAGFPIHEGIGNDYFTAELHLSDGSTVVLEHVELNDAVANPDLFGLVSGVPLNINDLTELFSAGQTGWLFSTNVVSVSSGLTTLHFHVANVDDALLQSTVLIDNVIDPPTVDNVTVGEDETPTPITDYLLTFARAIGDIDSYDMDDPGVAVSDLTSEMYSDNNFEANLDAIRESLVVVKEFMEKHINDFGNAINYDEIKAQLDSLVARIDAARENTGDISTLRSEIETILDSINCKENSVICYHNHDEHNH